MKHLIHSLLATLILVCPSMFGQTVPTIIQNSTDPCDKLNWDYTLNDSTGVTNWSTSGVHHIVTSIIIPDGQELIVSGGAQLWFAPGCEIQVKIGGSLQVFGNSTLLTSCDDTKFWDGIDVEGTLNQPQTDSLQGIVTILDHATISRAKSAIEQIDNCNTQSGGIILANDAYFINNLNSITFHEWGEIYENESELVNCTFKITPDYDSLSSTKLIGTCTETIIDHQVKLTYNQGLEISGCHFINRFNAHTTGKGIWSHPTNAASGIFANDSEFKLHRESGTCPNLTLTGNYFYGWYNGIIANYNTPTNRRIEVVASNFVNNRHGIRIFNPEDALIYDNSFSINDTLQNILEHRVCNGDDDSRNTYGIYIHGKVDSLRVIKNDFEAFTNRSFTGITGLYYNIQSPFSPSSIQVQGNDFSAGVDSVGLLKVASANGVVINNHQSPGEITLECNDFDMNAAPLDRIPSNFRFYDFRINSTASPLNINFDASMTHAQNTWTNYDSCLTVSGSLNKIAYNIWSLAALNYTYGINDTPSCNNVNVDTIYGGALQNCPSYDACSVFGASSMAKMENPSNSMINNGKLELNEGIRLYPNPASNELVLESISKGISSIININGQEIKSKLTIEIGINQVDISELPPAVYFLHFKSGSETTFHRFIKE